MYHRCFLKDPTLATSDRKRVEAALAGEVLFARAIDEAYKYTRTEKYYVAPKSWPVHCQSCLEWFRARGQRLTARKLAKWFARIERGGCGACGRAETADMLCGTCREHQAAAVSAPSLR